LWSNAANQEGTQDFSSNSQLRSSDERNNFLKTVQERSTNGGFPFPLIRVKDQSFTMSGEKAQRGSNKEKKKSYFSRGGGGCPDAKRLVLPQKKLFDESRKGRRQLRFRIREREAYSVTDFVGKINEGGNDSGLGKALQEWGIEHALEEDMVPVCGGRGRGSHFEEVLQENEARGGRGRAILASGSDTLKRTFQNPKNPCK